MPEFEQTFAAAIAAAAMLRTEAYVLSLRSYPFPAMARHTERLPE